MRAPLVLTLALLTLPLAGCVGGDEDDGPPATGEEAYPQLSPKRFVILPPEEVWVLSSVDGKRLNNVVYRPDTSEPVPAFINFSPYWGDTATAEGDNFARYMIHEYVPRGYAVVLSAVRGTGHSEGCFQIAGDIELSDAYDVVDHFANAEWSNGNVGAGGKSYDSTTQNGMIAKFPHPALRTIFHVSGITDMYRYNYREGVPYFQGFIFNTYYQLGQGLDEYGLPQVGTGGGTSDDEDPESIGRLIDDVACVQTPQVQASGVASGASGQKDAYWVERDWNRYIASSETRTSIFFVHGLQDWNVKPDHILPWLQELPAGVTVKGWLHQDTYNLGHVYPMRADWNVTMLRWLDHWLKGIDTGVLGEPAFEVEGSDGIWRSHGAWPPVDEDAMTTLPLDGLQTTTVGDRTVLSGVALEAGSVQTFRYSGEPTITITAVSETEDPVLAAVLYDESPSGERTWVNEAVLRGLYRNGFEEPEPVPVGEPVTYTLRFYPQDDVLGPGHKWVVELGGLPSQVFVTPAQERVQYEVAGGLLSLPLVGTGGVVQPQPDEIPCFAC